MAKPDLGPIQTIPAGLLGLLELKTLGRLPDALSATVTPTVDMLEFWLRQRSFTNGSTVHGITQTTAPGSPLLFSPTPIVVPENQWWYFHEYSVIAVFTAAAGQQVDNYAPMIMYNRTGTINYATLAPGVSAVSSATQAVAQIVTARDFWANPGSGLGLFFGQIVSAAGVSFTGRYRATALNI